MTAVDTIGRCDDASVFPGEEPVDISAYRGRRHRDQRNRERWIALVRVASRHNGRPHTDHCPSPPWLTRSDGRTRSAIYCVGINGDGVSERARRIGSIYRSREITARRPSSSRRVGVHSVQGIAIRTGLKRKGKGEMRLVARSKLVGLVFEAWDDLDRVTAGLDDQTMMDRSEGGSAFGWTIGHVTTMIDAWINVRFAGHSPHPLLSPDQFRLGASGIADNWPAIAIAVADVRRVARAYLADLDESALDQTVPYDGSFVVLREPGLTLRYALLRIAAHHYYHIGEIASKRDRRGDRVGDYPGLLQHCI